ncbi:MAG TPA: sulfatase-like hydrolase/transferase, partial [Bacteroidia bacterium]|nr:sulfatase-like hydrolase/transferase [Bacteroidia bacterium]
AGLLPAQERPNIVFFLADDQTSSSLGCYGNPVVQTPNLDALASRGVRFDRAFVNQSICWVSRTTIHTGLVGRSYGTPEAPDQTRPDVAETLVSDRLRAAGYRTGFFGKWNAMMPPGYDPAAHFDEFEAVTRMPYYKTQPDGSLRHETEIVVDRGIAFLEGQPKDRPFVLNLWFNACHAEDSDRRPGIGFYPWPRSVDGLYEEVEMPLPKLHDPAIFDALPEFYRSSLSRERYFWALNTPEKYQANARAYARMVTGIDREIGRFLEALEKTGLAGNTIVVYSADNGYHFGNRGLTGKWSHFEESLNVPLIVADPRVPEAERGKVSEALAVNLDLPSTLLDWAGAEIPVSYQGRSLRPLVEGAKPDDWRTETYHEHFAVRNRVPAWEGVRTERFKYARYFDHGYEFLHDLENDPGELVNLAADPAHVATLAELRARTDERVAAYGGALPPLKGEFQKSTDPYPTASAAVGTKPDAEGFVSLFDGKSLRGWTGDPQYWSVEDGTIVGKADGNLKRNHFLTWTGSTVRNFELRVKVKVSPGGNSGLQYRGQMHPEIGLDCVSGYQCDVVAGHPDYDGMLYEERGRRILSHTGEKVIVDPEGQPWVVGTMEKKVFPPGEWRDYRVLVEGNHHRHWIDGHPTADLIDFDEKGRALEGVLAVQVHVGPEMEVRYKDFKIKHLPDDLPLLEGKDHPIPADAYGVKPQGKLPPDWKAPRRGER